MNEQEAFDEIVISLIKQRGPSVNLNPSTNTGFVHETYVYNNLDTGRKCAAGFAIRKTKYKTEFENNDIQYIINEYGIDVIKKRFRPHIRILNTLQMFHDQKFDTRCVNNKLFYKKKDFFKKLKQAVRIHNETENTNLKYKHLEKMPWPTKF